MSGDATVETRESIEQTKNVYADRFERTARVKARLSSSVIYRPAHRPSNFIFLLLPETGNSASSTCLLDRASTDRFQRYSTNPDLFLFPSLPSRRRVYTRARARTRARAPPLSWP